MHPVPGMHELILEAIRERRLLMFGYRDTFRIVEPHRYGEAANGHRLLSAWLRPGHSRTTPEGGWRNFLVTEIENPQLLDETFAGPREGYAAHDERLATIYGELELGAADTVPVTEPAEARHIDPEPPRKDEIGA